MLNTRLSIIGRLALFAALLTFVGCDDDDAPSADAGPLDTSVDAVVADADLDPDADASDAQIVPDAGEDPDVSVPLDADVVDADLGADVGTEDLGAALDAGEPDAGELDAAVDAGEPDAGEPDAAVDAGEPPTPCDQYCDLMSLYCADTYPDRTHCRDSCLAMRPGDEPDALASDTLACRTNHAALAMADTTHCQAAAADGGGICTAHAPTDCERYCDLMGQHCADTFADGGECAAVCAGLLPFGQLGDRSGDSLQCRLTMAEGAVLAPAFNCPSAGPDGGEDCTPPFARPNAEPDSRAAATPLHFDAAGQARVRFELNPAGDRDWFSFHLEAPAGVWLWTADGEDPAGCAGDTLLDLYRAQDAEPMLTDDADGPGTCSELVAMRDPLARLHAGDYLVRIRANRDAAIGASMLTVQRMPAIELGEICGGDDERRGCAREAYCSGDEIEDLLVCALHRCGDGLRGPDEACEDGNDEGGDGCSPECEVVPIALEAPCEPGGYPCVDGAYCAGQPENHRCITHVCGDGVLAPDEACDDWNNVLGDGCEACVIVPIAQGAPCVAGGLPCVASAYCDDAIDRCQASACGDGVRVPNEECDDNNRDDGDGCAADCTVEVEGPRNHEPDALNAPYELVLDQHGAAEVLFMLNPTRDEDWFRFTVASSADLTIDTVSWTGAGCEGDTLVEIYRGDQLIAQNDDQSAAQRCAGVRPSLQPSLRGAEFGEYLVHVTSFQGVATGLNWLRVEAAPVLVVDSPCDQADLDHLCPNTTHCPNLEHAFCTLHACGDGVVGPSEGCDDGNRNFGDGCDGQCQLWPITVGAPCDPASEIYLCTAVAYCHPEGNLCVRHRCGDGLLGPTEACDDGNVVPGDGCDALCQIQPIAEGNPCDPDAEVFRCVAGTQCDTTRNPPICVEERCGDQHIAGEERCDDGNAIDGDGCTACQLDPFNGEAEPDGFGEPTPLVFDDDGVAQVLFELTPLGDQDYFVFELDAPAELVVEIAPYARATCDAAHDTFIDLFVAGEFQAMLTDDNGGVGHCSAINPFDDVAMSPLPAGRYIVRARGFFGAEIPPAWMRLRILTVDLGLGDPCLPSDRFQPCPSDSYCPPLGGLCTAHACGDGLVAPDEACDDANDDPDDGCTAQCELAPLAQGRHCVPDDEVVCSEESYCAGIPPDAVCTAHACGDGVVGPEEECDDGNLQSGDGCTVGCLREMRADLGEGGAVEGGFAFGSFDAFSLHLNARSQAVFFTSDGDGGCPGDTLLQLSARTPDGLLRLDSDDDGGVGFCSYLTRVLEAGDYVITVRGSSGAEVRHYTLTTTLRTVRAEGEACDRLQLEDTCLAPLDCARFERGVGVCTLLLNPPVDEAEPNQDATEADMVVPNVTVHGEVDAADAYDTFAVDLEVPSVLDVTLSGADACPEGIEVALVDGATLDAEGAPAAVVAALALSAPGVDGCPLLEVPLPAGRHYVLVYGAEGVDMAYEATFFARPILEAGAICDALVREDACPADQICADEDGDRSGRCSASVFLEGVGSSPVHTAQDELQVFEFVLETRQYIEAWTTDFGEPCGLGLDTVMQLNMASLEGGFDRIAFNDDQSAGDRCSALSAQLPPGRYRLLVGGFNGAAIDARLSVALTPVHVMGEVCDRAALDDVCRDGSTCLMGDEDGVGQCGAWATADVPEFEPDDTTEAVDLHALTPDVRVSATLTAGDVDVYALDLEHPAQVVVETSGGVNSCPGDTRIYRISGEILDAEGPLLAISDLHLLARDDDHGIDRCSLLGEVLPAGRHYFAVDELGWNDAFDYEVLFTARPVLSVDARCDAALDQNVCDVPMSCVDANEDGDGVCE